MIVHDESEHPDDPQETPEDSIPQEELQETIDRTVLPSQDPPAHANVVGHHHAVGHPPKIGGYKIVRVIGEGGMGTTYEAVQATPRRRVAVKVIRAARFSEAALRRFE